MPDTVMIVAGETSGELYGALLSASLKQMKPDVNIVGIGGERMKEAGVTLVSGISGAFGLTEAFSALRQLRITFRNAVEALRKYKPVVLVLIDYPDFNLKLAEKAKTLGIPILYYVSPQVWVWRKKRIYKIARLVNRMAVILPFEEKIYRNIGLDCEFVGHPVYDEIQELPRETQNLKASLGLHSGRPVLALLPGSRPHELDRLLPVMRDTVRGFKQTMPDLQFCMPLAPNTDTARYAPFLEALRQEGVVINERRAPEVLSVADAAVIASGTATLQAALLGVPMAVIYKVTPLTFFLGKLILNVSHVSLVNILAGQQVVREFLQEEASADTIAEEIRKILHDGTYRAELTMAYDRIRELFAGKKASQRVAEMTIQMAGWSHQG